MKKLLVILCLIFPAATFAQKWEACNSGLENTRIESIIAKDNYIFAGSDSMKIFRSSNLGQNWDTLRNGLYISRSSISSLGIINTTVFANDYNSGIYFSDIDGDNWQRINYIDSAVSLFFSCLTINNDKIYVGRSGSIHVSDDKGKNREFLVSGSLYLRPFALAFDNNNIVVGTGYGKIILSTDNGNNWELSYDSAGVVLDLAMKDDLIFAAGGYDIFRSTDKGKTWEIKEEGLPDGKIKINDFLIYGDKVFIATEDGTFYSTNNGDNWLDISDGLESSTQCLTITNNTLYAGTYNKGVYRLDLDFLGVDDYRHTSSDKIFEVYPNPASDKLTITAKEALSDEYSVKIMNETGRTLISRQSLFQTSADINISDLSPGMYFVIISCGDNVYYDKLIKIE